MTSEKSISDTLGGRIVIAREAKNLSTAQLARRLGVKTETLHSWETDRSEPRSNRLTTLSGMLSVTPTWLLTGAGDDPETVLSDTEMMQMQSTVRRLREQLGSVADELQQLEERLMSFHSFEK